MNYLICGQQKNLHLTFVRECKSLPFNCLFLFLMLNIISGVTFSNPTHKCAPTLVLVCHISQNRVRKGAVNKLTGIFVIFRHCRKSYSLCPVVKYLQIAKCACNFIDNVCDSYKSTCRFFDRDVPEKRISDSVRPLGYWGWVLKMFHRHLRYLALQLLSFCVPLNFHFKILTLPLAKKCHRKSEYVPTSNFY